MSDNLLGLYIHIPFCKKICPYCDFPKTVGSIKTQDEYIKALLAEMKLKKLDTYSFKTVYIGGGTPSSLSKNNLELLLLTLSKYINLSKLEEFSIEANPEDITDEFLKLIKKYHINRLSIGIQTFNNKYQKLIDRFITINRFNEIVELLKVNNFDNYSFDLMYGFNGQTKDEVEEDIDILLSSDLKHLSIYCLAIEPHTIFEYQTSKGAILEASENDEAIIYQDIIKYLKTKNFNQYEISNFCLKGYESKHNLIYWDYENFLSLGLGATSFYNGHREKMTSKMKNYITSLSSGKLPERSTEDLEIDDLCFEYTMMNLRKTDGLNLDKFKDKLNNEFKNVFKTTDDLINLGYLKQKNNYIYIPRKYRFVSNSIIIKLINNMEINA